MSDIPIPDHVIIRLVGDIDRGLSRAQYEELLVLLQLYGLDRLRYDDNYPYCKMNKREMITETLREQAT